MSELGLKFECSECGTKFYDLGNPAAVCPKCEAAPERPDVQPERRTRARGRGSEPKRRAEQREVEDDDGEEEEDSEEEEEEENADPEDEELDDDDDDLLDDDD